MAQLRAKIDVIVVITLEETQYKTSPYGAWYGDSLWTNDVTGDKLIRVSGQKTARDDYIMEDAIKNGLNIGVFVRHKKAMPFTYLGHGKGILLKEKSTKGLTLFDILIKKSNIVNQDVPEVNPSRTGIPRFTQDCFTYLGKIPPSNPCTCFHKL